jgi:hypothetical protein
LTLQAATRVLSAFDEALGARTCRAETAILADRLKTGTTDPAARKNGKSVLVGCLAALFPVNHVLG